MPLTPFHISSLFFLYFKAKRYVDPLALAVSTTFIDLEPLYYLIVEGRISHRIWHGYALALTVFPVLVTIGVYLAEHFFEKRLMSLYRILGFKPVKAKYSASNIYAISVFGGFSHIFLDMFTHYNMRWVFYPFAFGNPFYSRRAYAVVGAAVVLLSLCSLVFWLKSLIEHFRESR